jgi:hypothetical protein
MTGAITVYDEYGEYWEISNIEVTNTFVLAQTVTNHNVRNTHWHDRNVTRRLASIMVVRGGDGPKAVTPGTNVRDYNHVYIKNCYAHDVQSEQPVSSVQNVFGTDSVTDGGRRDKVCGGIFIQGVGFDPNGTALQGGYWSYNDILFEGNIIKRVAMTGFRNGSGGHNGSGTGNKVIFRGNYIESCGGDGFVHTRAAGQGENRSIVENNIIKDACTNPNNSTYNYAAAWAIYSVDSTLRYNECYGSMYGYQDSEAWDFDGGCVRSVYEYNYSHHNAGGSILFMGAGQANCVYRFNISANDGIGARGVATVTKTVADGGTTVVNPNSSSYTAFVSQSVFHYASGSTSGSNPATPLIHNNTIYIGDGFTVGLFGQNQAQAVNYYVRFYNNILIKEGEGQIHLARGHNGAGNNNGSVVTPNHFKNNILWGYDTNPASGKRDKFANGNTLSLTNLLNQSGSRFINPMLKIQKSKNADILRAHRDTAFSEDVYNDPAALEAFVGTERLRRRASIFAPINADSPAIRVGENGKMPGMVIPIGTNPTIDNAWNGGGSGMSEEDFRAKEDFFGVPIAADSWPIGAAAAPYTPPRP